MTSSGVAFIDGEGRSAARVSGSSSFRHLFISPRIWNHGWLLKKKDTGLRHEYQRPDEVSDSPAASAARRYARVIRESTRPSLGIVENELSVD